MKQDIAAWLPKAKPGGVLAGHDYSPEFPAVIRAVKEAFSAGPIKVRHRSRP